MSLAAVPRNVRVRALPDGRIVVRFAGVEFATDYNIYMDTVTPPVTLEHEVDATIDNLGNDTYAYYSHIETDHLYVAVSALDHLGSETALSDITSIDPTVSGATGGDAQTDALRKAIRSQN